MHVQLCPTLRDPMDHSPPGSPVHGISPARLLEWVAISQSRDYYNKFLLKNNGLPWWLRWSSVCWQRGRPGFDPWVGKIPGRRKGHPTPVLLPEVSYGRTSLVGYSPWGCKKSDTTERLHLLQKKGFPR